MAPSADEHKSAVGRAIDYIRQCGIFQVNICLRLEAGFTGDALERLPARELDPAAGVAMMATFRRLMRTHRAETRRAAASG